MADILTFTTKTDASKARVDAMARAAITEMATKAALAEIELEAKRELCKAAEQARISLRGLVAMAVIHGEAEWVIRMIRHEADARIEELMTMAKDK